MESHDNRQLDELTALVRGGDVAAFEPIVRRFERQLRGWLAAHSQPGIDIDEVAQRTFIAAYSNIEQYQQGSNFSAWLFTIARYQLQTEMTRLRRLADYHSKFAPDLIQQLIVYPDDDALGLWDLRMQHLRECLKQLSSGLQQYLKWRYEDQISIEQIATTSGRSVSAVKKQLWLLRQKLLRCIQARMTP